MRVAVGRWLLVVVLLGCAPARDMDERIAVEPGGRLEVDLDFGDGLRPDPGSLEVASHDAAEVRILAGATGWGASGVRFRAAETDRSVRLSGRVEGAFAWMFGGPNVQVRVAATFYRDRSDGVPIEQIPFSADMRMIREGVADALAALRAGKD